MPIKKLFCSALVAILGSAVIAADKEVSSTAPSENAKSASIAALVTGGPMRIDLATALRLARAQNIDIALARESVNEAQARLKQKQYLLIPDLSLGASFNHADGPLQASGGGVADVTRSANYFGAGVGPVGAGVPAVPGLSLTVNLADAMFEPLAARQDKAAAEASGDAIDARVLLQVAEAYFDLSRAQARVTIATEAVKNSAELAKLTSDFAASGEGLQSDAQRAEVERLIRSAGVESAREELMLAGVELCRLLHLGALTELSPVNPVAAVVLPDSKRSLTELVGQALAHRPEMRQGAALVGGAAQRVKQATYAPLVPNVALGASGGGFGGGRGGGLSGTDRRTDLNALVFWRVNNLGFGAKERKNERKSNLEQAKLAQAGVADAVIAEVRQAYAQVSSRQRQIAIAEQAVKTAQSSYQLNRSRISERQGLPIEVLQAIQSLADARVYHADTVAAFNKAQYRLRAAIGHSDAASAK